MYTWKLSTTGEHITSIIRIAANLLEVTRYNTLHHEIARNLFDATVLALQLQSCDDMM